MTIKEPPKVKALEWKSQKYIWTISPKFRSPFIHTILNHNGEKSCAFENNSAIEGIDPPDCIRFICSRERRNRPCQLARTSINVI